jgi:hypothetical protein
MQIVFFMCFSSYLLVRFRAKIIIPTYVSFCNTVCGVSGMLFPIFQYLRQIILPFAVIDRAIFTSIAVRTASGANAGSLITLPPMPKRGIFLPKRRARCFFINRQEAGHLLKCAARNCGRRSKIGL